MFALSSHSSLFLGTAVYKKFSSSTLVLCVNFLFDVLFFCFDFGKFNLAFFPHPHQLSVAWFRHFAYRRFTNAVAFSLLSINNLVACQDVNSIDCLGLTNIRFFSYFVSFRQFGFSRFLICSRVFFTDCLLYSINWTFRNIDNLDYRFFKRASFAFFAVFKNLKKIRQMVWRQLCFSPLAKGLLLLLSLFDPNRHLFCLTNQLLFDQINRFFIPLFLPFSSSLFSLGRHFLSYQIFWLI